MKKKKLIQSKNANVKRLLAFAFIVALALTALSSCSLGGKDKMSDSDRAAADAVFKTTEGAAKKDELRTKLIAFYENAQKDEEGFALLPGKAEEEAKAEKDAKSDEKPAPSVSMKIDTDASGEKTVTFKVAGTIKGAFSEELNGEKLEKFVFVDILTLTGALGDDVSADAAATTIAEDIFKNAEGMIEMELSDGKTTLRVPFEVEEIALRADTVAASKVKTAKKDFGEKATSDEINATSDAIKEAISLITPAANRAVSGLYDPYADAIDYIAATKSDKFTITEVLRIPIGWILEFSFKLVGNYALALLIFALAMKLILFPFGIMQQKSSIKQAKFAPKQKAIMKKYEGRTDQATKQKMQQEIMDAQQEAGVNALGGCLPLLIQFPILFALFNVVRNPLRYMCSIPSSVIQRLQVRVCSLFANGFEPTKELLTSRYGALESIKSSIDGIAASSRGELASSIASKASGVDTLSLIPNIHDHFDLFSDLLSGTKVTSAAGLPDFHLFGNFADLSVKPGFWNWMLIIPVLTFVIVFLTSKLNKKLTYQPPQQDGAPDLSASMKIMDYVMPLFSAYIAFIWPAIMGLYWIYQNLFGVLQQLVLKKMFPLPEFSEEDYKKAEIEVLGKNPKKPKYVPNNSNSQRDPSKPKSLHHIDDDDDDEIPVSSPAPAGNNNGKKKNALVGTGALKDYSSAENDNDEEASADADEAAAEAKAPATATLNGEKLPGEYTPRRRGKKSHRVSSRPVSEAEKEAENEEKE